MKHEPEIIDWLLKGDVSIQYQTYRDLLGTTKPELQKRIEKEGWGQKFLSFRNRNGHWGRSFYQPKWISTHYTLLDLKNLSISQECIPIKETLHIILENEKGPDGGLLPSGTTKTSDVCVNGMALNYLSYFQMPQDQLKSIVDFLLSEQMQDGGFNCHSNRKGAHHSSLHSTISVLEGINEYHANQYSYRIDEMVKAASESKEFILEHRLFKSDKTGEIIHKKFIRFPYPSRWYYDVLRALDYFQYSDTPYDERMQDAIDVLLDKRNKSNTWNLQAPYSGEVHFQMEKAGSPSRWNTLRSLRVLKHFHQ